jgi:hypothetical protein
MMNWTVDRLSELARSYQPAAVFAAAADLDLFSALAAEPLTALALSRKLGCDLRALTILLDALTALELLVKHQERYSLPPGAEGFLTATVTCRSAVENLGSAIRAWIKQKKRCRSIWLKIVLPAAFCSSLCWPTQACVFVF